MKNWFINFFKCIKSKYIMIIILSLVGASIGAVSIYSFYNPNHEAYQITFKTSNEFDINTLKNYEYINTVKEEIQEIRESGKSIDDEGNIKYPYSSFSYVSVKSLSKKTKVYTYEDKYVLSCLQKDFNTWQQARRFMLRMINNLNDENIVIYDLDSNELDINSASKAYIINTIEGKNVYVYTAIGLLSGFLFSIILLAIVCSIKKDFYLIENIYDNQNIYKTPFHKNYWIDSKNHFTKVKDITMMSILLAMMLVCKLIPLPSGFGNLGLSLGFIFFAVAALLYGPISGIIIGLLSDILGFLLFPDGYPFHFGYVFNAMFSGFVYAILFYKTKITFSKCFFARLIVNIFVNAFLGSIWWGHVADLSFDATISYMLTLSLPKNIAYLLPQSILLFIVFKALSRVFKLTGLVDERICDEMTFF